MYMWLVLLLVGSFDGPVRHRKRLLLCSNVLVRRGDGPRVGALHLWLRSRPICAGCRRGRKLSGGDKDSGGVVPETERALATGIFNSGSNVGAIVGPLAVPFIAVTYGWQ